MDKVKREGEGVMLVVSALKEGHSSMTSYDSIIQSGLRCITSYASYAKWLIRARP